MGLLTLQGSTSRQSTPEQNEHVIDNVTTQVSPEQRHVNKPYTKDSFINKNSLNIDRYSGVLNTLERFIAGSDITVTYYHNQVATTNDLSNDADRAESLDPVHSNVMRIESFQFKLQDPMDFAYDGENTSSEYRGTGICYSGFTPVVGDWFLYEIEAGVVGRFEVDGVPERLSIDSRTCHTIPFRLTGFPDEQEIQQYETRVRKVAWFDLQTFLLGNATLLTSESYEFIMQAERTIRLLKEFYYDKFYERLEYKSYLRPDSVYDPYIVDFMNKVVGYDNVYNAPQQLITNRKFDRHSIWNKLLNPDLVPWYLLKMSYTRKRRTYSTNSVSINCLLNREYVELTDGTESSMEITNPYIFEGLTDITSETYSDFDKLVCGYLNSKCIHTQTLVLCIDNFMLWSEMDQFYRIPIMLLLLKESVRNIREGSTRITNDLDSNLPSVIEFTESDLVNGILTLQGHVRVDIVDMETPTGIVSIPEYTMHTLTGTVINIRKYCTNNDIEMNNEVWKIKTTIPATIRRLT